jgi:hypothetical protein
MQTAFAPSPANVETPGPLWRRLADEARELGLTRDTYLSAVRRGQIPVRIAQFGAKGGAGEWHVSTVDARAYRTWLAAGGGAR